MTISFPTLVIFCKRPKLHQGKQRLSEDTSPENALQIAQALLACAIEDASTWQGAVVIACSDENDLQWAQALLLKAQVISQLPLGDTGNLGERLNYVDAQLRSQGHTQLVIIGTDSPILSAAHYQSVLTSLHTHDIALCHADDGGVVIMANATKWPKMAALPWSSNLLSDALFDLCRQQALHVDYALSGYDIDYVADLEKLYVDLQLDIRPARQALITLLNQLFSFSVGVANA